MPIELTAENIKPLWAMGSVLFAFFCAVGVSFFGSKLPRRGDWVCGLGLLGLLGFAIYGWVSSFDPATPVQGVLRGWIWPKDLPGALNIGLVLDPISFSFAALSALIAGILVIQPSSSVPARIYGAATLGAAGVSLAWLSSTPGLALMGLTLATLGGVVAVNDPKSATRFGFERGWGILLASIGSFVLAASTASPNAWPTDLSGQVGAVLLAVGLILQLQLFPWAGWLTQPTGAPIVRRIVLNQVFPAWAALSLFVRYETQFRSVGVFPGLGWFALISAVLVGLIGLLQSDWKYSHIASISVLFSIALAALCFGGASSGLPLALSAGLAGTALSLLGTVDDADRQAKGNPSSSVWLKIGSFLAALSATGAIGFASAGGIIRWLTSGLVEGGSFVPAFALPLFVMSVLAWKTSRDVARLEGAVKGWKALLAPYGLLILSLGVIWTGTASGGAISGNPDLLYTSWLGKLLVDSSVGVSADLLMTASWIHWATLVAAIGIAFWSLSGAGSEKDWWSSARRALPRATAFVLSGYGVDRATARIYSGIVRIGQLSVHGIDRRVWNAALPRGINVAVHWVSESVSHADQGMTEAMNQGFRRLIETPAKALQLIQNGNVQWYLFFAVGSGIAILIHFLR